MIHFHEQKNISRKILTDTACFLLVALQVLFLHYYGQPYERGFFCDDNSLRLPFKSSTISSLMLYTVGTALPILTFLITEYVHFRGSNGQPMKMLFGRTVHPLVWKSYQIIGVFLFGAACSHLITDIAKYSTGQLRPHFFKACDPIINCSDPRYNFKYITNFKCRTTDKHILKGIRLSFPSGHASFSAFTMTFLVMYMQARVTWQGSHLLKHLLQFVCVVLALLTACSRVSDYKHHWSDVLAGSLQGAVVAIAVVLAVSDLFRHKEPDVVSNPRFNSLQHSDVKLTRYINRF